MCSCLFCCAAEVREWTHCYVWPLLFFFFFPITPSVLVIEWFVCSPRANCSYLASFILRADSASDSSLAISFRILQPASAAATASGPWRIKRKLDRRNGSERRIWEIQLRILESCFFLHRNVAYCTPVLSWSHLKLQTSLPYTFWWCFFLIYFFIFFYMVDFKCPNAVLPWKWLQRCFYRPEKD